MNLINQIFLILLLATFSFSSFALETAQVKIDRVQLNSSSGSTFAFNVNGWGVCNNTKYVQLRGAPQYQDRFISMVLSAHMAQKKVTFLGSCTNSNGYLDAVYIKTF